VVTIASGAQEAGAAAEAATARAPARWTHLRREWLSPPHLSPLPGLHIDADLARPKLQGLDGEN
jgi:hypothetical protein